MLKVVTSVLNLFYYDCYGIIKNIYLNFDMFASFQTQMNARNSFKKSEFKSVQDKKRSKFRFL